MICPVNLVDINKTCKNSLGGLQKIYFIESDAIISIELQDQIITHAVSDPNYDWCVLDYNPNNAQFQSQTEWQEDYSAYSTESTLTVQLQRMDVEKQLGIDRIKQTKTCVIFLDNNGKYRFLNPTKLQTVNGDTSMDIQGANQYVLTFKNYSNDFVPYMTDEAVEELIHGTTYYTLTATVDNGTATGTGTYQSGATATLTAVPNTGYKFDQWSDGNRDNPRTIIMDANKTFNGKCVVDEGYVYQFTSNRAKKVVVWFHPCSVLTYTIETTSNKTEAVLSGAGQYEYDQECTINATMPNGTILWWKNNSKYIVQNPYTFNVQANGTYIAEAVYGTLAVPCADGRYKIVGDGYATVVDRTYHTIDEMAVEGEKTIQVEECKDIYVEEGMEVIDLDRFKVTLISNKDRTSFFGNGTYDTGDTVRIAGLRDDSTLLWWTDEEGNKIEENPYTFEIDRDRTFHATFIEGTKHYNDVDGDFIALGNGWVGIVTE